MAPVSLNKVAGITLVILASLLAAGGSYAAKDDRGTPSSREARGYPNSKRVLPLPLGCWVASDGFVHSINTATGAEEVTKPACMHADGVGITVMTPTCVPSSSSKYQFKKTTKFTDCPSGQNCYQGVCKVKPKPIGCYDSDAPGKSDSSTWGSWFDKYNPQIKTQGFVKTESVTGKSPDYFGDTCKDSTFMYEQICTDATPAFNFQQNRKAVSVKCPVGYWCKDVPVTDLSLAFGNLNAKGEGAPKTAAACVPKPDPCEAPWNDMCPDIEGCQKDPGECPPSKDICDSLLTKDQMQTKYGPDTSIFPMMGGGWVADSCATTYTVKHEWCDNGTPKSGISPCTSPDTCSKGLCGGKQVSLPGGKTTPDCEDTDIMGSPNSYGKLDVSGQIVLKGKVATATNDICKTNKILLQFKCDAGKPEGYSSNLFTCAGNMICMDGTCFKPVKTACTTYVNPDGVSGVKGSDPKGKPFDVLDQCAGGNPDQIQEVVCDEATGYKLKDPKYCPDGKTCKDGLCVSKVQKSCGPLSEGNGVGVVENGKTTEFKDKCSNSISTSWACDPNWNAVSKATICPLGCNADGNCVKGPCTDSDPKDNPALLGTVQWLDNDKVLSDKDFCEKETGKLVQVFCASTSKGYTQPAPCPAGQACDAGVCKPGPSSEPPTIPPPDKCAGKSLDNGNKCQKGVCDPQTGAVTFKDWIVCDPGEGCIPATGACSCKTKTCPSGQGLNPQTCQCGSKPPACYGMTCKTGETLDETTCTCKVTKPDTDKGIKQQPCSPSAPNGVCSTPGDICYNGSCIKDLCIPIMPTLPMDDACTLYSCSPNTGKITSYPKFKEGADPKTDVLCYDDDKDEVPNSKDNCLKVYNPDQADTNKNNKGDVCEVFLAAAPNHTCASFLDGSLKCWGANYGGELGIGKKSSYEWKPGQVVKAGTNQPLKDVTGLACGLAYGCALQGATDILCWGDDAYTMLLENGTSQPSAVPIGAGAIGEVQELAAGAEHTCALLKTGLVRCWGSNEYGQLGAGKAVIQSIQPVDALNGATDIAAAEYSTCAVTLDGHVKCWGANFYGQLGNGEKSFPKYSPVDVLIAPASQQPPLLLSSAHQVVAGSGSACALLKDGTVMCWGNINDKPYAIPVVGTSGAPITGVIALAVRDGHACVVSKDGTVSCWGGNYQGQVTGTPSMSSIKAPVSVQIPGITGVTQVAAGVYHTCARVKDMGVKCWGSNDYGQLMQPLYGLPSCMVQDIYGNFGCADDAGKKLSKASLVCDDNGNIDCKSPWMQSSPLYQIECPSPATEKDQPKCIKIDFGLPNCLGPQDINGKPTPACSKDVWKVVCDLYGNMSCGLPQWTKFKPVCSDNPNTPPTCIESGW